MGALEAQRQDLLSMMLHDALTPGEYTWARAEYIRLGFRIIRMVRQEWQEVYSRKIRKENLRLYS
jgi:hypothetical protein